MDDKTIVTDETVIETVETQEKQPVVQLSKAEQLRELSKEYGFDAFKPEEVKGKLEEFTAWQESQKSEQDKLNEQLQSYESQVSTLESQLAGLKLGIADDSLQDAMLLAKNYVNDETNLEQALTQVLERYPAFKAQEAIDQSEETAKVKVGTQINDISKNEVNKTTSEVEAYLAKYKNTPYYNHK